MRVKDGMVHVPIEKLVVLGPYETRTIVPSYEVSSNGPQTVVGTNQIPQLLLGVLLKKTIELGIQVFNSSKESKYLSQKLTLAGIVMYSGATMTCD